MEDSEVRQRRHVNNQEKEKGHRGIDRKGEREKWKVNLERETDKTERGKGR